MLAGYRTLRFFRSITQLATMSLAYVSGNIEASCTASQGQNLLPAKGIPFAWYILFAWPHGCVRIGFDSSKHGPTYLDNRSIMLGCICSRYLTRRSRFKHHGRILPPVRIRTL